MRKRCLEPNALGFCHYGGRGIKICARWEDFENFLADMGERPKGTSLDRINVDGDYEPSNCRWATKAEQNRNKRGSVIVTYQGRQMCAMEAAELSGLGFQTLRNRMRRGWPEDEWFLPAMPKTAQTSRHTPPEQRDRARRCGLSAANDSSL